MSISGEPAADPLTRARLRHQLSMPFVLDTVAFARGDRHLLDTLLLTSIVQANVAAISRQPGMQLAYAGLESPPPDELRRPVSINALATSLRLPFETVRRRVRNLAARDLCRVVEGGVIVPQSVLSSPSYVMNAFAAYERLRAFYYELSDRGLLVGLPAPTVALGSDQLPVRAVARLTSDYVLRVIDGLMTIAGGLLNGLVLLAIFRGNVEHLATDGPERRAQPTGQALPDVVRRPARLGAVAARVGLPPETVRRHVTDLERRGLVARAPHGLVVPGDVLASPAIIEFIRENVSNLQRLFNGLAQFGVLAAWEAARVRAAGPDAIPQNG
jgi:hypothetical protein